MTDELQKRRPAIDPIRVPGTRESASRENDVIAGDDDLAGEKSENARDPSDTGDAARRGFRPTKESLADDRAFTQAGRSGAPRADRHESREREHDEGT